MKRFNKLTAWLLTFAMLMAFMPGFMLTASAAEEYNLWVGGVRVTSDNLEIKGTTGKAIYNPDENTLTLDGYTYEGAGCNFGFNNYMSAAIYYGSTDTLTLVLAGENSVTHLSATSTNSYCVYADGSITVLGNGSLTAVGGKGAREGMGILTDYDLTVSDNARVIGKGGETTYSYGVNVLGSITVSDNGSLTGNACENDYSYGVYAYKGITVSGNGSLNGMGNTATNNNSCGVKSGNGSITISDYGSLLSTSGTAKQYSRGIEVKGSIEISDNGSLLSTSGTAGYGSTGVYADKGVTVSGNGSLKAIGGEAPYSESCGVFGGTTVNGGTVVAQGVKGAFNKVPTIGDEFDASVWYGLSEEAANTAGAKTISDLTNNYNQYYVKIAKETPKPPAGSVASVTPAEGEPSYYSDITAAISAAQNSGGSTLTLLDDINASFPLLVWGTFTIDLNGKTWDTGYSSGSFKNCNVIITDNSTEGTGKIVGKHSLPQLLDNTKLEIAGGTIEMQSYQFIITTGGNGQKNNAEFILSGGKLVTINFAAFDVNCKSVTIKGGEIESGGDDISYQSGILDFSHHPDPTGYNVFFDYNNMSTPEDIRINLPKGYCLYDLWAKEVASKFEADPIYGDHTYTIVKVVEGNEPKCICPNRCSLESYNGSCNACLSDVTNCKGEVLEDMIAGYDENTKSATVTVKEAGTYTLIFAKYGDGNRLDNVDIVEFEFKKGENTVPHKQDFTLDTGDKIMLWNNMITPLCDAYIVKE